jgi:hypothetical protein
MIDQFELWNPKVEVNGIPQGMVCQQTPGYFDLGDSGHGFNHGSAMGELISSIVRGKQPLEPDRELSSLVSRASEDYESLDGQERKQAGFWFRNVIGNHEAAWKYYSMGLMDVKDHDA